MKIEITSSKGYKPFEQLMKLRKKRRKQKEFARKFRRKLRLLPKNRFTSWQIPLLGMIIRNPMPHSHLVIKIEKNINGWRI